MFETLPLALEALGGADDAALVAAIEDWAQVEAAAGERRLAAIAELTSRRCDKEGKRAEWACDGWDSVAAEVAYALKVRHNKASSQMSLSLTLRHQLPQVASLYAEGNVSYRVITAIAWHTDLVTGGEPVALIDSALAKQAAKLESFPTTSWPRPSISGSTCTTRARCGACAAGPWAGIWRSAANTTALT